MVLHTKNSFEGGAFFFFFPAKGFFVSRGLGIGSD